MNKVDFLLRFLFNAGCPRGSPGVKFSTPETPGVTGMNGVGFPIF